MPSWFETGYDGVEREREAREKRRSIPWRFFLKTGQSSRIIFLDDFTRERAVELPSGEVVQRVLVPFAFNEHNLTIDGDWKNWLTCLARTDPPCLICNAGHYKYYIGMYTILSEWLDKDDVAHWSKRLYAAKLDGIERVRKEQAKIERKTGDKQLQFALFEVSRLSDRSVVTGDDFDFDKRMTRADVEALLPTPAQGQEPLTLDPYPYEEMFAPWPRKKLEELLKSGRVQPPRKRSATFGGQPPASKPKQVSAPGTHTAAPGTGKNPADSIDF